MGDGQGSDRSVGVVAASKLTMGKGPVFMLITGVVLGMLLAGLAIPYIFGEPLRPEQGTLTGDRLGSGDVDVSEAPVADGTGGDVAALDGGGSAAAGGPRASAGTSRTRAATGGGTVTAPSGSVGASDVGVTADTIKIGFLLLDVGSLSRVGIAVPGADPAVQQQAFQAQLDDVNKRGGIHGRKLVGVYQKFDVLSQDNMRQACLALRDQKVFGIVAAGGYFGPSVLCITEEGGTPLVTAGTDGTSTEYVRRSQGLLFSMFQTSNRQMANWAAELHSLGMLANKKIGVVTQGFMNPGDTVVGGELSAALKRFDQSITHVARLSDDLNTAASQMPIEVQQMRSKEVNLVLLMSRSANSSAFVQTADNQGYRPQYSITDWASMNNDTSNQNMPASYDGTPVITTYRTGEAKAGIEESPAEKECRAIFERGLGRPMDQKDSNEHGLNGSNCTTLKAFLLGLEKAGRTLTRGSFSTGMQSIGVFPMSMWGGGSFAPGKFGAADLIRTSRWFGDCRCIKPVSAFRESRF